MTTKTEGRTSIEVLDAIMGSGKTQGIIKWMSSNPQEKYLYVSPMLTEVESRIPSACEELEFTYPNTEEHKTKSEHLLSLLKSGKNISFTHALFSDMTREHLYWINKYQYILIVDEEIDFIESYTGHYGKDDITSLEKSGHIKIDFENLGKVSWTWDQMEGNTVYSRLKRLCDLEMLYCGKSENRDSLMVIHLPLELVSCSKRTIVLSYLFKGSLMEAFLKLRGVEVKDFKDFSVDYPEEYYKKKARNLITLVDTRTTKACKSLSMSYTWYTNSALADELDKISKAILSVYRKVENKEEFLFTAPKEVSVRYNDKGKKSKRTVLHKDIPDTYYLYSGTRATNDYANKSVLVHAYNRHPNLVVNNYLTQYASSPSSDVFALAEMIQWIWRSRIRKKEPIQLCILNKRMERLFKDWLYSETNQQ